MSHEILHTTDKAEFLDERAEKFHQRIDQLIGEGREIFVFRGAGTNNGIAPEEFQSAVNEVTAVLRDALDEGRKFALLYDGDDDNRSKPDIGAVFGAVADEFRDNPDVLAIAAQKQGWYYPKTEGAVLESANGTRYETYVLPDSTPLQNGDRYPDLSPQTDLTQSETLAQYEKYQQLFVGPAGPIAAAQLHDLNDKADGKTVNVLVIATHNNAELAGEFKEKREAAFISGDVAKVEQLDKIIEQRKNTLGALYNTNGTQSVSPSDYENLSITFSESIISQ